MVWLLKCFNLNKYCVATFLMFFLMTLEVGAAPSFSKRKVTLGSKTFVVEVAETAEQHERGLMFRTQMGENEGMLFIFPEERMRFFWMKNTLIDLSIGYFDKSLKLIEVIEMKNGKGVPDLALPSYASSQPAQFALEMNKGWFDRNKIKVGSKLKLHKK